MTRVVAATAKRRSAGSKGELTRQAILEHATALASRVGLSGLTIGHLAEDLSLSKSGLFAHFRSKQALQIQVLEFAAGRFADGVIRPALAARRGEPRVRALFERWLEWGRANLRSGCLFVAAASELDDQPGPVREQLVRSQKDWLELIANCCRTAVSERHFRKHLDAEQFAHDVYGVMLAWHHAARLMRDPAAERRARVGFDALVQAARLKR